MALPRIDFTVFIFPTDSNGNLKGWETRMHVKFIETWKTSLGALLAFYERKRGPLLTFLPLLFLFFVVINIASYWLAMVTIFPHYTFGSEKIHYFKVQFPVGILGAIFDTLSFFVTLLLIRGAIRATRTFSYIAHLGADFVIAMVATCWVVLVFSFSGWVISYLETDPQSLATRGLMKEAVAAQTNPRYTFVKRTKRYTSMVENALIEPSKNERNILFGLIMGISSMIPTCTHLVMFFLTFGRYARRRC